MEKIKQIVSYTLIILLLPYILTIFLSGPSVATGAKVDDTYVRVKVDEEQEMELSLEEYGIGILAKDIPVEYEEEALKAQAVLVRTSLYKNIHEQGTDVVLTEEFWSQEDMEKAWGVGQYSKNYRRLKRAWEDTREQVLLYEDALATTSFFRLSNGSTRDGKETLGKEYPYLKIVDCPADIESVEQIQTTTIDDIDAEVKQCDTAGYVLKVRVGDEIVSGEEFRQNYHLASSCFSLQSYEGKLRITTRGVGHGVGMSQYTANEMAAAGSSYEEILEYFFAGTSLREVADIVKENSESKQDNIVSKNFYEI